VRSYPKNSPQAAARIVALVLISDGHVCRSEMDTLNHLQIESALGLAPGGFAQVVQTLCEDMLLHTGSLGLVDPATLDLLLAEVDAPALRLTVLRLADAAIVADHHLSDAETQVMTALHQRWVLAEPELQPA
jgi:hypothetical protein